MTEKEKEALNALIGIANGVNSDIIQRQDNYYDARDRPRFVDTESSRESLVQKRDIEKYLGSHKEFFKTEAVSEEEMKRAREDAMKSGYGFAGFVDMHPQGEGPGNLMSEFAKRQQDEMNEIKKQQSEMISETKKTNELLSQLVGALVAEKAKRTEEEKNN